MFLRFNRRFKNGTFVLEYCREPLHHLPGHAPAPSAVSRRDQYELLELDRLWARRLPNSRQRARWRHILQALVCYQLIDPGSEWRLHRLWFEQSSMTVVLGRTVGRQISQFGPANVMSLRRGLRLSGLSRPATALAGLENPPGASAHAIAPMPSPTTTKIYPIIPRVKRNHSFLG